MHATAPIGAVAVLLDLSPSDRSPSDLVRIGHLALATRAPSLVIAAQDGGLRVLG
ncbi:MAG: hypothetical protein RL354_565 [Planctomycetota bacterium]